MAHRRVIARCIAVLAIAGFVVLTAPAAGEGAVAEAQAAEADKAVDSLRKVLGEMADEPGMEETIGREAEALDKMRRAYHDRAAAAEDIEVTDADRNVLRLYAQGEYAEAREALEAEAADGPEREFPIYLLGCIAFDQGDYERAESYFERVYELNDACTTALLMSTLSGRCAEHEEPIEPLELMWLACDTADKVGKQLSPPEEEDESLVMGPLIRMFSSPATEGPMPGVIAETAGPLLLEHVADVLRRFHDAEDLPTQVALAMMLKTQEERNRLLERLATSHPQEAWLHTLVFMARYYYQGPGGPENKGERFGRDLEAALERDPDNGALIMLQVEDRIDVPVPVEGSDIPRYEDPPLEEHEIELLSRALEASRFESYRGFGRDFQTDFVLRNLGGLAIPAWPYEIMPFPHWGHIIGRATASIEESIADGDFDSARALYDTCRALIDRIEADGPADLLCSSNADRSRLWLLRPMYLHAVAAGDGGLLAETISEQKRIFRLDLIRKASVTEGGFGLFQFPGRWLLDANMAVGAGQAALEDFYRRQLRDRPERLMADALAVLKEQIEIDRMDREYREHSGEEPLGPVEAAKKSDREYFCESLMVLGDLGDPAALSTVREFLQHPEPCIAAVAAETVEKLAARAGQTGPGGR